MICSINCAPATPATSPPHKVEILEDKDWVREWMDQYQPVKLSDRLWICPSWREPVDPDAANLILDPGLAFGTGTHPTTHLCLQWLAQAKTEGKTVIDYGCGSGILAIAALLLGAESALAIDNDPQALTATQDNASRNQIAPKRLTVTLPRDNYPASADILLANILAQPLIELAGVIAGLVKPSGQLALSGILESQWQDVAAAYSPWFELNDPVIEAEWVRLNGIRK